MADDSLSMTFCPSVEKSEGGKAPVVDSKFLRWMLNRTLSTDWKMTSASLELTAIDEDHGQRRQTGWRNSQRADCRGGGRVSDILYLELNAM